MPDYDRDLTGVRIVHAATSANMLTAFGRVMANRLMESGAELYLLASSRPIYDRPANTEELRKMGGRPLTIPLKNNLSPWNLIRNTYLLWRLFRRIRPEIVHTRASVMGIVGRTAARLAQVPCIVHHQDDLHAREANLSAPSRWLSTRLEQWFANGSDHTFVVSSALEKAAVLSGFDPDRVTNVGHDLSFAIRKGARNAPDPSAVNQLLARNGVSPEHFVIGTIARLERHKGIDTLIRAAAIVARKQPSARFVIRGRGPELGSLKDLIGQLDLHNQVILVDDWLNDDDLVALYQRFQLFALPTRREGFGMAFAEAMLIGAVPVAPNIEPVNEVVTPHTGILVEPEVEPYADALIWAISHPEEVEAIRQLGKKEAECRWGGTAAADTVISTYHRLLANKK